MENVYIVGRENFEDEVKVGGRADMQRASTIWIRMRLRRLFMKWWFCGLDLTITRVSIWLQKSTPWIQYLRILAAALAPQCSLIAV
jgi:hypothetical protein